ncbi:DUF3224 domain-containing protein [Neisseriaceae bacterium JH1-16]|nr:DUF3224 domain-containing protein [Neisseriaceae bacterium JH1-16]
MDAHATGTFEVQLPALTLHHAEANPLLGRRAIDKRFTGDLLATSQGEMLSAGTTVPGSAGYVAIERVIGSLHGRAGSFVLQHSGTLTRGAAQLSVTVVPDSGTDALLGLSGRMSIEIADGRHHYSFDYQLPDAS